MLRDEVAKECGILLRGPLPPHVGRHRVRLQAAPGLGVARERRGAIDRELEGARRHRRELEPVPVPAASAISLASMTVSASPPTRATTGNAP